MIILVLFLLMGGATAAASRVALPLGLMLVASVPLGYVITGFLWVNEKAGIDAFLVACWKFLSGASGPGDVVQSGSGCGSALSVLMILINLVLILFLLVLGFASVFGTPIAILASFCGAIASVVTQDFEYFLLGMKFIGAALGAIVATGLIFRIMHVTSGVAFC